MVQNGDTRGGADAWWLTVVDAAENALFFWKAYLSIKQPLMAHDPIHP
jgi:hypothetical protein